LTVADPDSALLLCKTALTVADVVTLSPLPSDFVGTPEGATYNPVDDMNPTVWLPPATPLTCQVTEVFGDPLTEAVNCWLPKLGTVTVLGETLTPPEDVVLVTVTVADADFVVSACDIAVTVTGEALGTAEGAVYKPVLEMLPFVDPPATLHVTPVLDVPVTVAVNCCVCPTPTLAVVGEMETETPVVTLLAVPAHPENKMEKQTTALGIDRRPIKVLTEGQGSSSQEQESQSGLLTTLQLDYFGGQKDA
jgi:hypothetical protein